MDLFPDHDFSAQSPDSNSKSKKELIDQALWFIGGQIWETWPGDCPIGVMFDDDPQKMSIISVLGSDNQVTAFQVHRPESGLRFYNEVFSSPVPSLKNPLQFFNLLECEIIPRDDAESKDIEELLQVGVNPEFETLVPSFRSYRPGHYPWFFENDEFAELATVFKVFGKFHRRLCVLFKEIEDDPPQYDGTLPKIPVLKLKSGGDRNNPKHWKAELKELPRFVPVVQEPDKAFYPSELHRLPLKEDEVWEVGIGFRAEPIQENDERPYMPGVGLTVRLNPDEIPIPAPPQIFNSGKVRAFEVVRESFLEVALKLGFLPSKIRVEEKAHALALAEVTKQRGIELVVEPLTELAEIFEGMLNLNLEEPPPEMNAMQEITGLLNQQGIDPYDSEQVLKFFESRPKLMEQVKRLQDAATGNPESKAVANPDYPIIDSWDGPPRPAKLPPMVGNEHYHLHLSLSELDKEVWREISIPVDATFFHLHDAIQTVFGWSEEHLYQFSRVSGRKLEWELSDPEEFLNLLIDEIGRRRKKLQYEYDFGDGWAINIRVLKIEQLNDPSSKITCLAGEGAGPPENCGGIPGYYELQAGIHEWCLDERAIPGGWKKYFAKKFDPSKVKF